MNYKILFYVGCVITAVTLISTIVAFFKCNVIEIVCDLLGIKLQKKVRIKRNGKNIKSKTVSTTVKVKKKNEVKIRSKREIEERQNTKSYYVTTKKKSSEKTGRIIKKNETKEELEDTNLIAQDDFIEDTGIMEVEDTNIIDNEETSMMESNETSMIEEDTGVMGEEDTCIIDDESGIEEETSLIENEEETSLLDDEDETGLLDEEDETSLLGMDEEEEDETCLLGEENIELEDGFAEEFVKEIEIIVTNSNTVI